MVVEPAGFLTLAHRGFKTHAVLFQRHQVRHLAERILNIGLQPFQLARATVVLEQHGLRLEHLHQRINDVATHLLHAGIGDLHDEVVAKTVDHQPRQKIRLAVDQTIEGFVEQPLTQTQGHLEAMHQQ